MTRLTFEQVKHVAKLANLVLTKDEIEKFRRQLSEVLDYVDVLNEVETKGIESTSQVTGLENVWRRDQTGPSLLQEEALSGAKSQAKKKGCLKRKRF